MIIDLRYLPFEVPGSGGMCSLLGGGQSDSSVVLMQLATSGDGSTEKACAACLRWLLDRYKFDTVATDGVVWPQVLEYRRSGPTLVGNDDSLREQWLDPWSIVISQGAFDGKLLGFDSEVDQDAQTAAFKGHYEMKTRILAAVERAWDAVCDRCQRQFDPVCVRLIEGVRDNFDYISISKIEDVCKAAEEIGVDLSPFPLLRIVHEHTNHFLFEKTLWDADEAVPEVLELFQQRIPKLAKDLTFIWERFHPEFSKGAKEERSSAGPDQVGDFGNFRLRQLFYEEIGRICFQHDIQLDQFPELVKAVEFCATLRPLFSLDDAGANLDYELRALFRLLVLATEPQEPSSGGEGWNGELLDLMNGIRVLIRGVSLQITNQDFQDFLALTDEDKLVADMRKFKLPWPLPRGSLQAAVDLSKEFYFRAMLRGRHMGMRVRKWFEGRAADDPGTLLVTATGFLTPHILAELKRIPVVHYIITPDLVRELEGKGERTLIENTKAFYDRLYQISSYPGIGRPGPKIHSR